MANWETSVSASSFDAKSFANKAGFTDEKFAEIVENLQSVIKEGVDFLTEFFRAQKKIL